MRLNARNFGNLVLFIWLLAQSPVILHSLRGRGLSVPMAAVWTLLIVVGLHIVIQTTINHIRTEVLRRQTAIQAKVR